ncbi:MAG: glycosyltransferase family 4 protein, partial [Leptolyngbya sp. SIO4C1]|nr:glycosyltransferase family 4 protein [Leptolyngbya sp. SIO4C1]
FRHRVRTCLSWTDLILTISENSKKDIIEYFQIPPERIKVVSAATHLGKDTLRQKEVKKIIASIDYGFSKPYILFVGNIEPRKNIVTLIQAFNHLKKTYQVPHQLVLVGQKSWKCKPIFAAIDESPWAQEIHHLDYLSNEQLAVFYEKASVLAYPSYYEGFGLPVLESMIFETPVVTSNTSSLPEVAGEAALLINPNDFEELAEAILKVLTEDGLRQCLIKKGKDQAQKFSWQATARKTLAAYHSIMD